MRWWILAGLTLPACDGGATEDTDTDACPVLVLAEAELATRDVLFDLPRTVRVLGENRCEGVASLTVGPFALDGDPAFTLEEGHERALTLAPGEQFDVHVRYAPTDYGPHTTTLTFATDAPDQPEVRIPIEGVPGTDQDLDGFPVGEDCDDEDAAAHPGRPEIDDGVDQDCDGRVDEDFVEPGDVLLTELLLAPEGHAREEGQWFELFNTTDGSVDVGGWEILGDSGSLTVEGSVVVASGERVWVSNGSAASENGVGVPDGLLDGEAIPALSRVELALKVEDTVVHLLTLGPIPHEEEGTSTQLDPTVRVLADTTLAPSWCLSTSRVNATVVGTPGEANGTCPGVDHDGDGSSVLDGDCDDADPLRGAGLPESFDGLDNDCNDRVDDFDLERDGVVVDLDAAASTAVPVVGLGDLDADGWAELVVAKGGTATPTLQVYSAELVDDIDTVDPLVAELVLTRRALRLPARFSDATGDGRADLFVGARGSPTQDVYLLFDDGLGASESDAALRITSSDEPYTAFGAVEMADLDGDGVAELLGGAPDEAGRQSGVDLIDGTLTGSVPLEDARIARWYATPEVSPVGAALGIGDLDDDGYEDLVVPGVDAVHGILGGAALPDGFVSLVEERSVFLSTTEHQVVSQARVLVHDVDASGTPDLVLADGTTGQAHVWLDPASGDPLDVVVEAREPVVGLGVAELDGVPRTVVGVGGAASGGLFLFPAERFVPSATLGAADSVGGQSISSSTPGLGSGLVVDDLDADEAADLLLFTRPEAGWRLHLIQGAR